MSTVCEHCGHDNRATAMFCIGCAGKLPAFVPSGPSALEELATLPPGSRKRAARSVPPRLLPSETPAFWLQLGAVGVVMFIVFVGWYLHVTRKTEAPPPEERVDAPAVASPPRAAAVAPRPQADLQALAPPVVVPKAAPAQASAGPQETPVDVVQRFYRALSAGDGKAAAAIVVPTKRGTGPFNEANMSKFYGSFERPLVIRSIRQLDSKLVEAKYSYRVSRTTCEGTAIVETERVVQQTLIRRIRANC